MSAGPSPVTPELQAIFRDEGTPVPAGSNQAFWVTDPTQAWWLEAGVVDLFAVPQRAGDALGPRTHLLRLKPGQAVFGLSLDASNTDLGVLAVGTNDARICRLPLSRLQALGADPLASAQVVASVETWITSIYQGLAAGQAPTACEIARGGEEILSESPLVIRPAEGVIWAEQTEGRSLVGGLETLALDSGDGVLPLAAAAWLVTSGACQIRWHTTADVLRQDRLWPALARFHQMAARWAASKMAGADDAEATRLQAKAGAQHRAIQGAVGRLSSLLAPRRKAGFIADPDEDPLLAAARLVAEALNVTVVNPPTARKGRVRPDPLGDLAKASRIRMRKVVLKGNWWEHDSGPLLGALGNSNQPVALLREARGRYVLADPVAGTRRTVDETMAQTLSPVAHAFYPAFRDQALKVWDVFRFGLQHVRGDLWMVGVLALGGVLLGLLFPIVTGILFDLVIPSAQRSGLWYLAAALVVASLADTVLGITQSIALIRLETKADVSLQAAVWDRLLRLPLTFFRQYTSGDLAQRAGGVNTIRQMLSGALISSLLSGLFSLLYFGLLCYYSPKLTVVACLLVVLNLAMVACVSAATLRMQRPLYELQGKISGMVLELITGITKLRVAGAEPQAFAVWAGAFSAQKRLDLRASRLGNGFGIFHEIFPVLTSMVLFVGMAFWVEPGMSTGKFLAFSAAFMTFLHATIDASGALLSLVHAVPVYERTKPILEALPEVTDAQADPGPLTGRIELSHINFRYKADGPLILQDLSLQIRSGEFVAIVGPSGSGKSTLLRLLLGFETPASGTILYDGLDLAGLDVQAVRRQCGVVLQSGKLMPGDIFENIIGTSLLTLDDAWEAARMAGLEDDIRDMPMGMHTVIGEGSGTLSGGQRQRLMIARAIVTRPRILFFDEATSALDNRTQAIVSRSLEGLKATRVVIAHRLSTIQNADRIHVLQQGRLVQSGTFDELAKQPGPFAELTRRQLL